MVRANHQAKPRSTFLKTQITQSRRLDKSLVLLIGLGILGNVSTLLRPINLGGPGFGFGQKIWGPFSRFQNCDSPLFIEYLQNPSMLLSPGSFWQERPAYIILGKVISLLTFQHGENAFILLNFILLIVAGVIMFKALNLLISRNLEISKYKSLQLSNLHRFTYFSFPVLVVLMNLPSRGYFWTAHFQMFNLIVPALCLYHFAFVALNKKLPLSITKLSLLCGVGLLAYPGSNIYVFSIMASMLFLKQFKKAVSFVLFSYLPTVLWYLYIVERNGYFFSQSTVQWKQFVWIKEAFDRGDLLGSSIKQMSAFYGSFNDSYINLAVSIIIVSFFSLIVTTRTRFGGILKEPIFRMNLSLALIYFLALFSVGTYVSRLNWPLVVIVVTIVWSAMIKIDLSVRVLGAQNKSSPPRFREFLVGVIFLAPSIIWFGYFCLTMGPWS